MVPGEILTLIVVTAGDQYRCEYSQVPSGSSVSEFLPHYQRARRRCGCWFLRTRR
jgi:hypothetical protein